MFSWCGGPTESMVKTTIPADVRALIVRRFGAALASAWRRQQQLDTTNDESPAAVNWRRGLESTRKAARTNGQDTALQTTTDR
jgi:hypothetical protein